MRVESNENVEVNRYKNFQLFSQSYKKKKNNSMTWSILSFKIKALFIHS